MRANRAVVMLAVVLLVLFTGTALGQLPTKMNYQVMLTDDYGEPLADQAVTLFFTLHTGPTGGTLLWSESHNDTTNSIGVVSLTLGETSPLVPEHVETPTWLQVAVNGATLSPRRELVSSPYALQAGNAATLAGVDPEEYALDDDLSNTGVVNTPGNPVDWTMLKNVPYGFADGTDDGGAGDSHSLDAVDGNPVDAVYVDAEGRVGIGAGSPYHQLVVGPAPSGLSCAHFANPTTLYGQNDGFAVGIDDTGSAFISQNENASLGFLTDGIQRHRIAPDGTFEFGTSATSGVAEFYASGGGGLHLDLRADSAAGGHIGLFEESGDQYAWLEPDYTGTGGFLEITDGAGGSAFQVNGNYFFSGECQVSITGLYSSTYFRTGWSGDDSVWLPSDAVSADEIFDEAGGTSTSTTASLGLDGSVQTIASESIYCPAAGLVLALGTVESQVADNDATGTAQFAVSDDTSMPSGGGTSIRIPDTGAAGVWLAGLTVHGLFPVGSGTHTFYLLAEEDSGAWAVFDRTLTLVYLPTGLGVAKSAAGEPAQDPTVAMTGTGTPITEADIAAERAETEAFNEARVTRELAEMQAKIAEIQASMGNNK